MCRKLKNGMMSKTKATENVQSSLELLCIKMALASYIDRYESVICI